AAGTLVLVSRFVGDADECRGRTPGDVGARHARDDVPARRAARVDAVYLRSLSTDDALGDVGVDLNLHPLLRLRHVGGEELVAPLVEQLLAEAFLRLPQRIGRHVLTLRDADDHRTVGRRDGLADAAGRQRERRLVDLGAHADVRQRRSAGDQLRIFRLEALRLGGRREILRRPQRGRDFTRALLAQLRRLHLDHVVANAILHLVELRHVRILHVGDGDVDGAARRLQRLAHIALLQLERLTGDVRRGAERRDWSLAREEAGVGDRQARFLADRVDVAGLGDAGVEIVRARGDLLLVAVR